MTQSFVFYKMLNVMVQNLTVTKKSSSFNNINDTMEDHLLFQKYLNTCSLSSIAESSGDKKNEQKENTTSVMLTVQNVRIKKNS